MKNNISVSFATKTLSMTKSFYKKACKVGTPEYYELRKAMNENPTFDLRITTNTKKKTYSDLTIERMKEYISLLPNSEENLATLERVMKVAEAKGAKYPFTKKWFLATFPEYKENDVKEQDKVVDDAIIIEVNKVA